MYAIELNGVTKKFKHFTLDDISFRLEEGFIMGLIGSNGAGKTTIIKLIMGLYIEDEGDINVLGGNPYNQPKLKDAIGFVYDSPHFYDFKLKKITKIIRSFYQQWDQQIYQKYMQAFKLSENMRFKTMSRGMKLKYNLVLALSHHAKLLILDEPTSGLDPVFRNEFLSILQKIINEEKLSILFSSHITSDIEKIADYITYIQNGKIIFTENRHDVFDRYQLIKGTDELNSRLLDHVIGLEKTPYNFTALIQARPDASDFCEEVTTPTLEEIMYYHERGDSDAAFDI